MRQASLLFLLVSLWSTPSFSAVPQKMKDGLSSSSVKVKVIAVAAIVKTKDREAATLIRPLLNDSEPTVRAAVIDGLATLKDLASLKDIDKLKGDPDDAVKAVATRAHDALSSSMVRVDVGDVGDLSTKATPQNIARLQNVFDTELRKLRHDLLLQKGGVDKGYGAILKIRSVNKSKQDGNEILEVKCDMTLVEYPGKVLRLSSSATAGAGWEGTIPKNMDAELMNDSLDACAPALAKDFADYIEQRRGRL